LSKLFQLRLILINCLFFFYRFLPSPDMRSQNLSATSSIMGFYGSGNSSNSNTNVTENVTTTKQQQQNKDEISKKKDLENNTTIKTQIPQTTETEIINTDCITKTKTTTTTTTTLKTKKIKQKGLKQQLKDNVKISPIRLNIGSFNNGSTLPPPLTSNITTTKYSFDLNYRKNIENPNSNNNNNNLKSNSIPLIKNAKSPGSEVLTLISSWIKNAPNDFMDTRVLDEIKSFFNSLDSMKTSFKPWTSMLKHDLKIDEMDNYKCEFKTTMSSQDIINQYYFVIYFLMFLNWISNL
jgi:hypothetical protein